MEVSQLDLVDRSFVPPDIKITSKEGSSEHLLQLTKQRHRDLNTIIQLPWPDPSKDQLIALARLL